MSLAQDLKAEFERKHRGVKGFFKTKELQETIQDFRIRVNDLKTDFIIHCLLILVGSQFTQRGQTCLMAEVQNKEGTIPNGEFVIRITDRKSVV